MVDGVGESEWPQSLCRRHEVAPIGGQALTVAA
jgi:hypothetical protein